MNIRDCPFGFEDGHIVGYRTRRDHLEMEYEFWNGKRGTLVFEQYVGARDYGAIGPEVGSLSEVSDSDFIVCLLRRNYESAPRVVPWTHYQFLGVDDSVIFEVVSGACTFVEGTLPTATDEV
jgi:hypothetical protein